MAATDLDELEQKIIPHLPPNTSLLWTARGYVSSLGHNLGILLPTALATSALLYLLCSYLISWTYGPFTGWSFLGLLGLLFVLGPFWKTLSLLTERQYAASRCYYGASSTHFIYQPYNRPLRVEPWTDLPPLIVNDDPNGFVQLGYINEGATVVDVQQMDTEQYTLVGGPIDTTRMDFEYLAAVQRSAHQEAGLYLDHYAKFEA